MKTRVLACVGALSAAWAWCGPTASYWRFEEGKAGEGTGAVSPFGKAGVSGKGVAPAYDADVPFKALWDGVAEKPAVPVNGASLRFCAGDVAGAGAPVGGEIVVSGKEAAVKPETFTLEAFVKIAKRTARHALIASKRRNGQSGASWSLSVTPAGTLGVRFDTEQGKDAERKGVFNQCFGGSLVPDDGAWHHVALTYDSASREARLYVDYQPCGGGTVASGLVYDDSDLVIGRGLDGWLDEVRLTSEALHPEQFLRPTRFFSDMKPKTAPAIPLLDQTQTRVQSALKPELAKLGALIPKRVSEIETPMWSLGCETLDRDLANWDAYRGYLVPLGIKRIRLQGGWGRTEKKKGVYDFGWLDHIVDDAIALGLEVCLETSYGNHLYEPGAAMGPGGCLPAGDETMAAWDTWVEAMVRHYAPKGVHEWMTYNEPNLRKENTPEKIVANNIRTAEIIKRVDPNAKIGAFVLAGLDVKSMEKMLTAIGEQGKLDLFTWAIYHGYSGNPDQLCGQMGQFNAMLKKVAPRIKGWQGEAGCASEEVQYALSGIDWTEYSHAKWNARRMLCDIGYGIDSSVFTISDVSYSKDFISRYGLLKTNPDNSVIKVKTAYYAVQNVVTVFNGALVRVPDYDMAVTGTEKTLSAFAFRDKKTGLDVIALWNGAEIPGNGSDLETVQIAVKGGHFKEPVWVDLITGCVYAIAREQMSVANGTVTLTDIPVYDGPAAIIDKSLVSYEPVKVVAKREKKGRPVQTPRPVKVSASPIVRHLLPGTQQPAPAVLVLCGKGEKAASVVAWLNEQAVHAFVLAGAGPDATTAQETQRALRYIRSHAAEWQIKPDAIGVMRMGGDAKTCVLGAESEVNFVVVLGSEGASSADVHVDKSRLFVGAKDAWQAPLAQWLEKFKSSVF